MDGVFMRKLIKQTILCLTLVLSVWCGVVLADKNFLQENIIRMHVVANSDSIEDQEIKLRIRDAVLVELETGLAQISTVEAARKYLQGNLPKIEYIANEVLRGMGFEETAVASLCREAFQTREYDTFMLPAGVYDALRITIGDGEGKNWWCVVFPSLCIPAASDGVSDMAAGVGFPESLTYALTGTDGHRLRFFCMDALGKLENILFQE